MLIEISCSKFKTPKHPEETINFHPGLNVVLGSKKWSEFYWKIHHAYDN